MADFVAQINGLDFAAIDAALTSARTAIEKGQQLSVSGLDPTVMLGDLGTAVSAVTSAGFDPDQLNRLGRAALDALGTLIELPPLDDLTTVAGEIARLADLVTEVVSVLDGPGAGSTGASTPGSGSSGPGGGDLLNRVIGRLAGSVDLPAMIDGITSQAADVLGITIPDSYVAPLAALTRLGTVSGTVSDTQLLSILGTVLVDLDIGAVGSLVTNARTLLELAESAGDESVLTVGLAPVRLLIDGIYAQLDGPDLGVDVVAGQLTQLQTELGRFSTGPMATFVTGLAADVRTIENTLAGLDMTATLDRFTAALPRPGEDIPEQLLDSLSALADTFDGMTEQAVAEGIAGMRDQLVEALGLTHLPDLLGDIEALFAELGTQLDRLPLRAVRDQVVDALISAQQKVLAFDGFDFLDDLVAPVVTLEEKIRTLDLSSVTGAVQAAVDGVNGIFAGVDLTVLRDAVDAVIDPLGAIVDELVPFVRQVVDQLTQLVDQIESVDFTAAGAATLDLLHAIRAQVAGAVGGGGVPEPVKIAVAGAAAILQKLDLAAELSAPFGRAVVVLDVRTLLAPFEEIWQAVGDALGKATPQALIAELDPPFDQLLATLDGLTLEPLIAAVAGIFHDLVGAVRRLDPRTLLAPLEQQFQELVAALTAAVDPAPLFAPLRNAYQALTGLLAGIDLQAVMKTLLGGIAATPQALSRSVGAKVGARTGAATGVVPTGEFKLGDVLRPLSLFVREIRSRLAALAAGTVGPALAALADTTRGLRALLDPVSGFAARLGAAIGERAQWLDPDSGVGPLAQLRTDLESLRQAVLAVSADASVDASASARLSTAADGIRFESAVHVGATASVSGSVSMETRAERIRGTTDSTDLGRSIRVLAAALDAALPAELLTGTLDPVAGIDAFLDAVFERIDPGPVADQLDALGDRLVARVLVLAESLALGMVDLLDGLFAGLQPLFPDSIVGAVQGGLDQLTARLEVLDPGPVEDEARAVVTAAISLLAVHSPAALAARVGDVFDAVIDRINTLDPTALFAGLDPFGPVKTQLAAMRPSLILGPLIDRTASFTEALTVVSSIDLTFAVSIVDDLKTTFAAVLAGVQQEWNSLLAELAQLSGSASVSVG